MKRRITTFLVLIVLMLSISSTAFALATPGLCTGTNITGTVVAVDEDTGLITIVPTGGGDECTVFLNSDYGHPITTLLGTYFSDVNAEDLSDALDAVEVCVVQDPDTLVWSISDAEPCTGQMVIVTGDIGGGTFDAQPSDGGDPIILTVDDPDTSDDLTDALDTLNVDVNDDGSVVDVGDAIGDYHEDGYGFGILVKVYAIIEELEASCAVVPPPDPPVAFCGTTVAELIALLDGDASMGDLFAIYGKPSMVGVGHVRNADGSGGDGNGICNARNQGGVANASDQNVNCGTTIQNKNKDNKSEKGGDDDEGDDD